MAFGRIRSKKPDPDDVPPPPPPNMFDPDVIEAADEDAQVRTIVDGSDMLAATLIIPAS